MSRYGAVGMMKKLAGTAEHVRTFAHQGVREAQPGSPYPFHQPLISDG